MIEVKVDIDVYNLPMKIIDELSKLLHNGGLKEHVNIGVDCEYMIYLYMPEIERVVKHKSLIADLTGRGFTYRDACIDFIFKLLDERYNIRIRHKYGTDKIRNIIRKYDFEKYYTKYIHINEEENSFET